MSEAGGGNIPLDAQNRAYLDAFRRDFKVGTGDPISRTPGGGLRSVENTKRDPFKIGSSAAEGVKVREARAEAKEAKKQADEAFGASVRNIKRANGSEQKVQDLEAKIKQQEEAIKKLEAELELAKKGVVSSDAQPDTAKKPSFASRIPFRKKPGGDEVSDTPPSEEQVAPDANEEDIPAQFTLEPTDDLESQAPNLMNNLHFRGKDQKTSSASGDLGSQQAAAPEPPASTVDQTPPAPEPAEPEPDQPAPPQPTAPVSTPIPDGFPTMYPRVVPTPDVVAGQPQPGAAKPESAPQALPGWIVELKGGNLLDQAKQALLAREGHYLVEIVVPPSGLLDFARTVQLPEDFKDFKIGKKTDVKTDYDDQGIIIRGQMDRGNVAVADFQFNFESNYVGNLILGEHSFVNMNWRGRIAAAALGKNISEESINAKIKEYGANLNNLMKASVDKYLKDAGINKTYDGVVVKKDGRLSIMFARSENNPPTR